MKNILFLAFTYCLILTSCASRNSIDKVTLNNILEKKEFTFMAQRANPVNFDVIRIANSIPNYPANRMFDLDQGYSLTIKQDEVVSTLPYFGRRFSATMNMDENGYRFTSKEFEVMEQKTSKSASRLFVIIPKDVRQVQRLFIEIFSNGNATLSMDSSDRQAISYMGYITKNETK